METELTEKSRLADVPGITTTQLVTKRESTMMRGT